MLEDHSPGLIIAGTVSFLVYCCGLILNVCDLMLHYTDSPLIPDILREGLSNATASYALPVSLAYWSRPVWSVIYICQSFWQIFSLVNYCRQTATGPAYNNPKLLPVPVHVFFSLAILTQMGWLVMIDRQYVILALILILMCTGCAVICVCETYRALASALPMLQQQDRTCDLWAIRILAHNALAFFATWVTLYATLTFALFLTFGMENHHVMPKTGSMVQLALAAFLVFMYVLTDLTVFDKHSRFVISPYIGFVLFHSAQLNKDWPSMRNQVFIALAGLTAFTFVCVFIKVIVLICRQVPQRDNDVIMMNIVTRPLPSDLEEETYLLEDKR